MVQRLRHWSGFEPAVIKKSRCKCLWILHHTLDELNTLKAGNSIYVHCGVGALFLYDHSETWYIIAVKHVHMKQGVAYFHIFNCDIYKNFKGFVNIWGD